MGTRPIDTTPVANMADSSNSEDVSRDARQWLEDDGNALNMTISDEESGRITFAAGDRSFYVTVPPKDQAWTVWSDDSGTAHLISSDLDYLTDSRRSIHDILTKLTTILGPETNDASGSEGEEEGESEDDEDYYNYYGDDDDMEDEQVKEKEKTEVEDEEGTSADDFFTGDGSPAAVHRLLSDLKMMSKSSSNFGISGTPRGNNLFIWDVELSEFDKSSALYKDLQKYAATSKRKPVIELEMKFPKDYPMNPPFVRVTRPRIKFLTGHVTIGGSICMQMLTRSGWSPSNDIESILIQVRAEIMSDPNTRLDSNPLQSYSESEARQAFERMVQRYGWNR